LSVTDHSAMTAARGYVLRHRERRQTLAVTALAKLCLKRVFTLLFMQPQGLQPQPHPLRR
jgi:hypothetical protein